MVVIDSHTHLGRCEIFQVNFDEKDLIGAMDAVGIDKALVQPLPGNPDPVKEHDRIAQLAKGYPGRIYGVVAMNPLKYGVEATLREMERAVRGLDFRVVKIHTLGWAIMPHFPIAEEIIKKARELEIPVMVHTGGSMLSSPSYVEIAAARHPDVVFIEGHMGWVMNAADAIFVAQRRPNVVVETSWSAGYDIKWAVDMLGPEKVLMGTDFPTNAPAEMAKIKALHLTPEQEKYVLGESAARIFKI